MISFLINVSDTSESVERRPADSIEGVEPEERSATLLYKHTEGLPVGHGTQSNRIKRQSREVISRVDHCRWTESTPTMRTEQQKYHRTRTDRSHLEISCEAMSIMSSNIPLIAAVPNAGIRRRSTSRSVKMHFGHIRLSSRAIPQFSSSSRACNVG